MAIYADRLEVTSPGSLHFGITPENLFEPHASKPWNPLIAHTFYRRGIIEEWGVGTLKMVELVNEAGLPPLEIKDAGSWVAVCFRHGQFVPQPRTWGNPAERQKAILTLLEHAEDGMTRREIGAHLGSGVSDRQVRRALEELRDRGLIVSTDRGPLTRWMRGQSGAR